VKVSVQSSALVDLRKGFRFYEGKERGLGAYFLDSLYSDIGKIGRSVYFERFIKIGHVFGHVICHWLSWFPDVYVMCRRVLNPENKCVLRGLGFHAGEPGLAN